MFTKFYTAIFFLAVALMALAACSDQEESVAETAVAQATPTILPTNTAVPPTATHTPTPLPTATGTPLPTPTATATPVIPHLYVRGAHISVGDWSPDSQWLPYWLSTDDDLAGLDAYTNPGATLHLLHSGSKESCALTQFQRAPGGQMSLDWTDDSSLIVRDGENEVQWQGQPCQPDSFVQLAEPPPPPAEPYESRRVSPDGRFRVTLELEAEETDHWRTLLTTIRDEAGAEVTAVTWRTQASFQEGNPGGNWLSPTQFLIRHAEDGPLLLDTNRPGQVSNVQLDLFGLARPAPDRGVAAIPGPTPDSFYLLLLSNRSLTAQIQLFHASSGLVETLPYYRFAWPPFSPDGQWLLLYESDANDLWTRRVTDVDGEWRLLGKEVSNNLRWNEDGTGVALSQFRQVTWQAFPEGEIVGQWSTDPYESLASGWSPDGRFLVVMGLPESSWYRQALFLFERPGE
jgi:hypothetical protein